MSRHDSYGDKGGNDAGPLCLDEYYTGVRPALAPMLDIPCVCLGSRTLYAYDDDDLRNKVNCGVMAEILRDYCLDI